MYYRTGAVSHPVLNPKRNPVRLSDFDYNLPDELIATEPMTPRDHSRLLVIERKSGAIAHRNFFDLPDYLEAGDLLILNNTKVFPARLFCHSKDGKEFEVVLLERLPSQRWKCLVRPGKKIKQPTQVFFSDQSSATLTRTSDLSFEVEFPPELSHRFFQWIETVGKIPLPPYIKRSAGESDKHNYQTVFANAHKVGSIAAPTAGLHFTENLLETLRRKQIQMEHVTLHVGYGTFSPIQVEEIDQHTMHSERFEAPSHLPSLIQATHEKGRRVIAVGTTALRTLESLSSVGLSGQTDLFIRPGYQFQIVDSLVTNFHIPKSSLYVLVCALLGMEKAQAAYSLAIQEKYRFYSYGDAMLIL